MLVTEHLLLYLVAGALEYYPSYPDHDWDIKVKHPALVFTDEEELLSTIQDVIDIRDLRRFLYELIGDLYIKLDVCIRVEVGGQERVVKYNDSLWPQEIVDYKEMECLLI